MAYLNVIEVESALQNLASAYPAITDLITCPHVSHEGRQIHALRIGVESDSDADGVLLLGGVHAREWVPPDALVSLAADLLEAYQSGTGLGYGGKAFHAHEVRQVVETLNLFICACVNPDGRHYSQNSDPQWRKNRRPHPSGGNCVGVDINRNFDFLWDHLTKFASNSGVNTASDPCNSNVYRGPSPASEPETRNVGWLLDRYPRIRWHIDVHSAVPVILHSWGDDQNQTTDSNRTFLNSSFDAVRGRANDADYAEFISQDDLGIIQTLSNLTNDAVSAVRGDNYGVEPAFGLYPTSGASDDYAFSRHFADPSKTKIYGFTIECGHSFQPAWSEAEQVIREVSSGLIAFCLEASANATSVPPSRAQGSDIALVRQTPGWASIPVAFSNGDGTWNITNGGAPNFIPNWANQPGVRVVTGDFNGNRLTDIALVRQTPGWASIPVAFANGDGTWNITNGAAGPDFIPNWANQPGVHVVTGDFNGDGLSDIALVRQTPGWASIPVAFSNGDGTWRITNGAAGPDFIPIWANQPGVRIVVGDFNGDGLMDIALVRQTPGWATIPIAFSNGDGTWRITNGAAPNFIPSWANQPGVRIVVGDFNGDGISDIALVRQTPGWASIPIAFSNGDGTWRVTNGPAPDFIPSWANQPGVRVIAGDFNGDGITDIALVRQTPGWATIPIAFSNGDGTWRITNGAAPNFIPSWANQPGVRVVAGDFNRNGLTDLALVRQTPGWGSIPIAFSNGDGSWNITNGAAPNFIPSWANQPGVRVINGDLR